MMVCLTQRKKEDTSDVTQGCRFPRSFYGPMKELGFILRNIMALLVCSVISFCGVRADAAVW